MALGAQLSGQGLLKAILIEIGQVAIQNEFALNLSKSRREQRWSWRWWWTEHLLAAAVAVTTKRGQLAT